MMRYQLKEECDAHFAASHHIIKVFEINLKYRPLHPGFLFQK
jgi:hypothetical protein